MEGVSSSLTIVVESGSAWMREGRRGTVASFSFSFVFLSFFLVSFLAEKRVIIECVGLLVVVVLSFFFFSKRWRES